jgi:hypothetical protein
VSGVVLGLYPTQADALAQTSPVASLTTNSAGLWPYADASSRSGLWVRDPAGNVWPVEAAEAAAGLDSKADAAATTASLAGKVEQSLVGTTQPASITYAALQSAADSAATFGFTFRAAGAITTASTLTITSDCDLGGLTINYTGPSVAVQVGNGTVLRRKRIVLPNVVEANKPGTGWNAGTVGVKLTNLADCKVTTSNIQNFEKGLLCYGQGTEFAYNEISVHGLNNNKVNLYCDGDATGWCNANTFIGGRYSHDSGEGTQVAGVFHIYLADITISRPNGNLWVGASLESPNVVQYALNVESGQYNEWVGCRWEDTSGTPRVRWGPKAIQNEIDRGYATDAIAFTRVAGAVRNWVRGTDKVEMDGTSNPVMRLENTTSSANGALAIYNAGTLSATTAYSPTADWSLMLGATLFRGKAKTDTNDRLTLDFINRKITMAAGPTASAVTVSWGTGSPEGVVTANQGSTYYNYGAGSTGFGEYQKASGTGNTGWHAVGFQPFTTAARPTAALGGIGGTYYDTTLSKPGFSDGTAWRDAAGTAI